MFLVPVTFTFSALVLFNSHSLTLANAAQCIIKFISFLFKYFSSPFLFKIFKFFFDGDFSLKNNFDFFIYLPKVPEPPKSNILFFKKIPNYQLDISFLEF